MKVLFATGNPGKARELMALSRGILEVVTLGDLGIPADFEETGSTFEENSVGKAMYYASITDLPVVSDDSGLEVDWLNGAPGVHSARFLGDQVDDETRCRTILERMRAVEPEQRTARFRCVASCVHAGTVIAVAEGVVEGRIHDRMVGDSGFGYDPIFFYPPFHTTFADIPMEQKNQVSHRNKAFQKLIDKILPYVKKIR